MHHAPLFPCMNFTKLSLQNAKQLPTASFADRTAMSANLRLQFPVSSGSHHRAKEWVPVEPTTASKTTTVAKITTSVAATGPATTTTNTTVAAAPTTAPPAVVENAPVKPADSVFPEMPQKVSITRTCLVLFQDNGFNIYYILHTQQK